MERNRRSTFHVHVGTLPKARMAISASIPDLVPILLGCRQSKQTLFRENRRATQSYHPLPKQNPVIILREITAGWRSTSSHWSLTKQRDKHGHSQQQSQGLESTTQQFRATCSEQSHRVTQEPTIACNKLNLRCKCELTNRRNFINSSRRVRQSPSRTMGFCCKMTKPERRRSLKSSRQRVKLTIQTLHKRLLLNIR